MGRGRDRIPACDGSRIVERQEHEALLGKLGVWSGKDGDVLFAGTGVAMLAATVTKRIHAPHAHIFFESGGIGPLLEELPMAVADPRVMAFSNLNAGLVEAFSYVANRRPHTIAFLGAALTEPPTAEELRILRDDVDPQRLILG